MLIFEYLVVSNLLNLKNLKVLLNLPSLNPYPFRISMLQFIVFQVDRLFSIRWIS